MERVRGSGDESARFWGSVLGFGLEGQECGDWGLGFRVWGFGFRG